MVKVLVVLHLIRSWGIYSTLYCGVTNFIVNNINISLLSVFAIPKYGVGGVIFDNTTLAYIV
jgi:hypothetical protein